MDNSQYSVVSDVGGWMTLWDHETLNCADRHLLAEKFWELD